MSTLKQRFEVKFRVTPGCWLWTGSRFAGGYGGIRDGDRVLRAHRVSYELYRGQIPEGLHVMHRCDNPLCVNPDHLSIGTHQDNMTDMYSKGRRIAASGLHNGAAKLGEEGYRRILASNLPSLKLAPLIGVSASRIRQIRRAEARSQGVNHG